MGIKGGENGRTGGEEVEKWREGKMKDGRDEAREGRVKRGSDGRRKKVRRGRDLKREKVEGARHGGNER